MDNGKLHGGIMHFFLGLVFLLSFWSAQILATDKKPVVYFDLGNTIINTKDMKHIKYLKGARDYMEQLKREGFKIGIISNIPESWGIDYEEKLLELKKVIHDSWAEERPFDWSVYNEIILPLKNSEMKPTPVLFLRAIAKADSCPSVYIGESPTEITAAQNVGMAGKLYDENDTEIYIPVKDVRKFLIQNYKLQYDKECIDHDLGQFDW